MDRKAIITGLSVLLLVGCTRPLRVVVGSKNFTEQIVLGETIAQQIEQSLGVPVERKLNLGGTLLAHEALVAGQIDLYPEYSGTALTAVLKQSPMKDRATVFEAVRAEYQRRWKLEWLPPLGFNDTFAMIVDGAAARQNKLGSLSDAAKHRAWRLGVGYEFKERPDGLNGLVKAYGLRLDGDPVTMDLGLLYSALASHKVDMIAANSTDGPASVLDVKMLEDDKHYFPPYECAIVVRQDTLARVPRLREALEALSGRFSDSVVRKLNYAIDGQHRGTAEVAAEFLKRNK